MKNKGVVFDELSFNRLIKGMNSSYSFSNVEEALFALLMYDKVWVSNNCHQVESKMGEKLISEGLLETIPNKLYKKENEKLKMSLVKIQELKSKLDRLDFGPDFKTLDLMKFGEPSLIDFTESKIEFEEAKDELGYYITWQNNSIGFIKEFTNKYYHQKYKKKFPITNVSDLVYFKDDFIDYKEFFFQNNLHNKISKFEKSKSDYKSRRLSEIFNEKLSSYGFIDHLIYFENINYNYESNSDKKDFVLNEYSDSFELEYQKVKYLNEYLSLKELLLFSSNQTIPIKLSLKLKNTNLKKLQYNPRDDLSEKYRIYQILLKEIQYMPRITCLEDVLRLREDKRITQFRDVVQYWTSLLKSADLNLEEKIRAEILKTNKELKKLGDYNKISGWATYISLPFIAIDLMTGFPIGSMLTAISGFYTFKTDYWKKQNEWILFGSR